MRPVVFHGSPTYPPSGVAPVVTVGNFDGVHRGHAALLGCAVERARQLGAPAVAFTFDPSPVEVLRPDRAARRLQSLDDKLTCLGDLGITEVVVEPFDRGYAEHDARWFAEEVIGRRLRARVLVLGHDFRFGHGRGGGVDELRAWLAIPVEQVPALVEGESPISSSRVRTALDAGDVASAAALLGRAPRLSGTVVAGDRRGRTIGYPTANVALDPRLLTPAPGVYAVRAHARDGSWGGVANLGFRPTFNGVGLRFEVHLFGFSGDLYGASLAVDFVSRLRGEQTFASVEGLVAQIRLDAEAARAFVA